MKQKPIAISVIAAVGVAGILTLSVLAAISSTNRAFAQKQTTTLNVGYKEDATGFHAQGSLWSDSENKAIGGATITIDWIAIPGGTLKSYTSSTITNSDGSYKSNLVGSPHSLESITANYAGDSEHMPARGEIYTGGSRPNPTLH